MDLMFHSWWSILVLFLSAPQLGAAATSTCIRSVPSPIVLPVKNATLSSGQLRRGLSLQYGAPPQQLLSYVSP